MREIVIKRAQVYGMRCSGTNYLDTLIRKNLPGLRLGAATPRNRKIFGWKHSDVGTKTYLHHQGRLQDVDMMHLDWAESRDTLLFVIYRNPISWLQSIQRNPHMSPESYGVGFSTFIRQPFRAFHCDPPGTDAHPNKEIRLKQVKRKNMIEDYNSIFDLRKSKIMVFKSFMYRFYNVVYINLETLEQDPEQYLREIADCFNLRIHPRFQDVTTYKGGTAPFAKATYDAIDYRDLQHMLLSFDWVTESTIGYSLKIGARLLTRQTKFQTEPDNLLNIFSYKKYFRNGHLLTPFSVPA